MVSRQPTRAELRKAFERALPSPRTFDDFPETDHWVPVTDFHLKHSEQGAAYTLHLAEVSEGYREWLVELEEARTTTSGCLSRPRLDHHARSQIAGLGSETDQVVGPDLRSVDPKARKLLRFQPGHDPRGLHHCVLQVGLAHLTS